VTSWGFHLRQGQTTSGEVKVTKDLDISLEGADVLVVEDIVDSGVTLNYLLHVLEQRKPRSLRIAAPAGQTGAAAGARAGELRGIPDSRRVRGGLRA